jgi:hypothetical protein
MCGLTDDSDCRDDRKASWRGRLFLDSSRGAWHDGNGDEETIV